MTEDERTTGGGSGGGSDPDDAGNQTHSCKAMYQIAGNQVVLMSRKPGLIPTDADPSTITLLAVGGLPTFDDDGKVDIRGTKGVRITAGVMSLPMLSPPVTSDSTDGVEIVVDEMQSITIQRGLSPLSQKIEMAPNSITVDAGMAGTLTLKAGLSQIMISAEGITIQGLPLVQIN